MTSATTTPDLYEAVRYARNVELLSEDGRLKWQPLVGEESAFLTALVGFGLARRGCTVLSFSGTGKTVLADAVWDLLPDDRKKVVDMLTKTAIWHMAPTLNAADWLYFPEEQNASDNDEVVKVKKKLGEGKPAERTITGQRMGDGTFDTQTSRIDWKPDLSTMAITNSKAESVMDEESLRRRIIVTTDPTDKQTRAVLKAQARAFARGKKRVRDMTPSQIMGLKLHVRSACDAYARVDEALFYGMEAFEQYVPSVFTNSRSAFPMLMHVVKGVGLYYHQTEEIRDKTLIVSPMRFAETLEFYGSTFFGNCMKLPTMGPQVLSVFPKVERTEEGAVPMTQMLNEGQLVDALAAHGYSMEKKKAKDVLKRLVDVGFIVEDKTLDAPTYYRSPIADFENVVDWSEVIKGAREVAYQEHPDPEEWVKKHASGDSMTFRSPVTGEMVTRGGKVSA